ncbi:tandem five-TM protein [Streptococcus gordonii]|nr:tandem five-TM protein [Streptococcus gordonii]
MFKKVEMELLAKRNLRYRILKTEDKYYLLDVERPFLIVYFLPLLIYFVPHRCYEMSREEYEQLSQSEEKNARLKEAFEKHGLGYSLGAGVGAMLLSKLFDINQFLKFDSSRISNFLAILIVLLVFGLRLWLTASYEVPSGLKNRGCHKIYVYPCFVKELFFNIFAYIMSALLTIILISAFLTNQVDNYIVHIGLSMFLSFWLFIGNMFFMRPASNYWIKIKNG